MSEFGSAWLGAGECLARASGWFNAGTVVVRRGRCRASRLVTAAVPRGGIVAGQLPPNMHINEFAILKERARFFVCPKLQIHHP
jgi:hypothetical protein